MSSYKGLTTKELISRLTASDKEKNKLANLLKDLEPALAEANNKIETLTCENKELKDQIQNNTEYIVRLEASVENHQRNLNQALNERDNFFKEFNESRNRNSGLIRDLDYERKRRISAENKAFELETRLHNTAVSEYPACDVQSYMVGLRINRNGEIA